MIDRIAWVTVAGGICRFGDAGTPRRVEDLQWSHTPVTVGCLGLSGNPQLPVVRSSFDEALAIARSLGGRLPTSTEWEWMAAGAERRRYPWGEQECTPAHANLAIAGVGASTPVGRYPLGATPEGLLDVAGNVWEWTTGKLYGAGRTIRGGSYASRPLYAQTTFVNAAPAELRSAGIGLRMVRDL
jgi:formylglycine-generating enzyme required for sulfatase activity